MRSRFAPIHKRRRGGILGNLLPILFFIGIIILFNIGVTALAETNEREGLGSAQKAVVKAAIQCYALEGQYPPNIEYLQERYGLAVDTEKYIIHYNSFASNIMPQITVLPRNF